MHQESGSKEGEPGRAPGTVSNAVVLARDGDRYLRPPLMCEYSSDIQESIHKHIINLLVKNNIPVDEVETGIVWIDNRIAISYNDIFDTMNKICIWEVGHDGDHRFRAPLMMRDMIHEIDIADPKCFDKMIKVVKEAYANRKPNTQ